MCAAYSNGATKAFDLEFPCDRTKVVVADAIRGKIK